jgi:alkylation response protein AidB-like acyl-CoA dehydrogenase
MTLPDPGNPYGFGPYLAWRERVDWYADDPFLQALVHRAAGPRRAAVDASARALSAKASTRWRALADAAAIPERRPFLQHWDAHHQRIDRIVRPLEGQTLEREVFAEGLFAARTDTPTRLAKMALVYQNGEACTACPLVCTEGLVGLLARYADRAETRAMLEHLREGRDGDFAIGAQFLTEIQGGSDVPANLVEAVPDGDAWRLHGTKFFCSVAHADYAVVTAKPRGSHAVAAFAIPMWQPGAFRERRNGCTIDRLKWKLGTSELPTAEITFDGALAYALGPLDRGLANVVAVVLTLSRLTVGLASGAYMTRAAREAEAYAHFREAFGRRIDAFAMVRGQLDAMKRTAQRTLAAAFRIYAMFDATGGLDAAGDGPDAKRNALVARELIMLHKFVAAEEATDVIRSAMSIFGGNGVIEDFSCLPRLYRDSAVNELWEGPRNVLLAQVHRDLRRAAAWCTPERFVGAVLAGGPQEVASDLAAEFATLVAHPDLATPDDTTIAACERWEAACRRLMHAYQDLARAGVAAG